MSIFSSDKKVSVIYWKYSGNSRYFPTLSLNTCSCLFLNMYRPFLAIPLCFIWLPWILFAYGIILRIGDPVSGFARSYTVFDIVLPRKYFMSLSPYTFLRYIPPAFGATLSMIYMVSSLYRNFLSTDLSQIFPVYRVHLSRHSLIQTLPNPVPSWACRVPHCSI